ncbi:MAG: hypothetical protein FWF38_06255, partial [Spirochaetaceae bacterium]|nr:hypothetical protein [Spirochaetaceae bacterium]
MNREQMPAIKDIDKLKEKLNSLGNESAILAKTGKKSRDIKPKEAGVPDDISALLDNFSEDAENSQDAEDAVPDFNTLLNSDTPLPELDISTNDADAGFEGDLGLPELDSEDAGASDVEELDDNLTDAPIDSDSADADLGVGEDLGLPGLDSDDAEASAAEKGKEELGDLENIFGDDSIELNDDPNAILDSLSEQEASVDSSDDLDLGALDDIFEDKEQSAESPIESIDEEEPDKDFSLPDDLGLPDLGSDDAEASAGDDLGIDLPDLDLGTDADLGVGEDLELPDIGFDDAEASAGDDLGIDLPDLDLGADADLGVGDDLELPDLGSDDAEASAGDDLGIDLPDLDLGADADLGVGDDLGLPDIGSDDAEASAGDDLGIDLPDLDLGADADAGVEEDLELPELDSDDLSDDDLEEDGSADEKFDIASVDTLAMDDEFEKPESAEDSSLDLGESEQQEDTGTSSDFNLQDFGDKFGSVDDLEDSHASDLSKKAIAAKAKKEKEVSDKGEVEEERSEKYYISKEKLKRAVDTLSSYPGNLKIYIEDLIGNKEVPKAHLDNLVDKLVAGFSAREIIEVLFKITGKRIRIPAQYQRKTWQELEREKGTLAYIIRYRVLPFVGKALAASFAILFVLFLINNFIRKPIHSSLLYKKGYEALVNDNFTESEKNFLKASRIRPSKKQFYRYADALVEKREYSLAETKYLQLLGISLSSEREKPARERLRGFFPGDKRGFIDYSVLKTYYQGEYSRSEQIIDDFLYMKGNKWDSDMLVKKIDNYLNWAEIDNAKYDSAEYVINDSLSKFGSKSDFYLRRITHAVRSGKLLNMRNEAFANDDISTSGVSAEKRKYYGTLGQYRGYIENLKRKQADPYI